MMLPDILIRKAIQLAEIEIHPFEPTMVQPASIDIRLGSSFVRYDKNFVGALDPMTLVQPCVRFEVEDEYVLQPGEFLLGSTLERVLVGTTLAARIEGKSTLARLGLIVHSTAGFIDPGFSGTLTLEMTNINQVPIVLRPGMKIAQLSFIRMVEPPMFPYGHQHLGSHYQDQDGATPAAPLPPVKL